MTTHTCPACSYKHADTPECPACDPHTGWRANHVKARAKAMRDTRRIMRETMMREVLR
jgi:hypothetical protein